MFAVRRPKLCGSSAQLGPAAYDGQIWTCENVGMLATIGGKYTARLGLPRSSADELRRSLFSCSPRSMIAPRGMWSAFESDCVTRFNAQPSLMVIYDTSKVHYDIWSHFGAQEAPQRS